MSALPSMGAMPGFSTLSATIEAAITWGGDRAPYLEQEGVVIDSTCVDAGNTPTSYLRPGLLLGKASSGGAAGRLVAYAAGNTDGSQQVWGVLLRGISMLDLNGVAENKYGKILVGGPVKSGALIGLDIFARRQMEGRFQFDDDIAGEYGAGLPFPQLEVAKTANYQILAADCGKLFTNAGAAGAVTLTLPVLTPGFSVEVQAIAAQSLAVASSEGTNIVWDGNASASSLTFSTASHIVGGHLQFNCNAAGTKWYVRQLGPSGCTVTAA